MSASDELEVGGHGNFMATYIIIGGDGKQYGPITGDELRKWISEARLNAQSLAKEETDTEWRPLSTLPEFADVFASAVSTGAPFSFASDWDNRDYELDIGNCVSGGWNVLKNNFGVLFGGFLIMAFIGAACGIILNGIFGLIPPNSEIVQIIFRLILAALIAIVMGPLTGGVYYLFLRARRGQPVSIGEVFLGFQKNYKDLFLGYLVVALLVGACMIPYNVVVDAKVLPITEQMKHAQSAEVQNLLPQLWSALFSALPVLLICMIPTTYLTLNWQFTLPLILDRQMPFWTAMKTSWKMVHKHWWHVFGLCVVIGLISLAGVFVCCVGMLVTIPIGIGTMMSAYETIFGEAEIR